MIDCIERATLHHAHHATFWGPKHQTNSFKVVGSDLSELDIARHGFTTFQDRAFVNFIISIHSRMVWAAQANPSSSSWSTSGNDVGGLSNATSISKALILSCNAWPRFSMWCARFSQSMPFPIFLSLEPSYVVTQCPCWLSAGLQKYIAGRHNHRSTNAQKCIGLDFLWQRCSHQLDDIDLAYSHSKEHGMGKHGQTSSVIVTKGEQEVWQQYARVL